MPKQAGNILIILIVLLFLSFCALGLAKYLSDSQTSVEAAIGSRYEGYNEYPLSTKMNSPDKWTTFASPTYKFNVSYPPQWIEKSNEKTPDSQDTFKFFLSTRISLVINIKSHPENLQDSEPSIFGNNQFYVYLDSDKTKGAYARKNNLYYFVELNQSNYFGAPEEFKGTFFQILKRFEFLN